MENQILVRMLFGRGYLPNFQGILCRGFDCEVVTGRSLREVCCQGLGIAEWFLDEEIRAVFLDGHPVDDLNTAIVLDGSQIALSGSLPGLAGISMRRGSPIVSFRREISYRKTQQDGEIKTGRIQVKLFNLVADKLGPVLLRKGIVLKGNEWQEFLEKQPPEFWQRIQKLEIDGKMMPPSAACSYTWSPLTVRLVVETAE